ncbi:MAG: FeoB-associated Cys-rich membrane protein [Clostridiaceae bacterium]|jgi:hypothetical protein|nr:FeoB-associated Cys-rich membrane protein [Clostridiaceae bacterium]
MLTFIVENLANIIISAAILGIVVWISTGLIKKRKSGKSIGCSCSHNCASCPSVTLCSQQVKTSQDDGQKASLRA